MRTSRDNEVHTCMTSQNASNKMLNIVINYIIEILINTPGQSILLFFQTISFSSHILAPGDLNIAARLK